MLKLAIVSRDHTVYESCFNTLQIVALGVELIYSGTEANQDVIENADILLSEPDTASDFICDCVHLKWMQSAWAGNNRLQQVSKRDYILTSTKGIFAAQMREYVLAYMLYFERKIAELKTLQDASTWESLNIATLSGKRLGIMGLGNIGCEVAKAAEALGMHVSAITANKTPITNVDYYRLEDIISFARECDYIVNLLPETEATKGVCDGAFFDAMKPNAVFLNAGRGSVLSENDVIVDALNANKIKAAVLDVFSIEPLPSTHPFYQLNNCYITNHTAAVSDPKKVFSVFQKNLVRFMASKPLQYVHDFSKGY